MPFLLLTGPAFKNNIVTEPFENVNIYPMIAHILGIDPNQKIDGNLNNIKHLSKMKILLQLLLIVLLSIQPLMAWGSTGHRIVGKVAEKYLTKNANMQIKKILGHNDLSRVSTWADEIKSDPNWKHAYDWHWCTIPDGEKYETGKHTGNAIEKVNEFIVTLKKKKSSKKEKQIALKFLVHLVGDLHQPLHVGNGEDRGGNDKKLKWFGEETNLHSIWDSQIDQVPKFELF